MEEVCCWEEGCTNPRYGNGLCRKHYDKDYYRKNAARKKAAASQRYEEKKEELQAYARAAYYKDKEGAARKARAWQEKNKEYARQTATKWRAAHPGYSTACVRRWREDNPDRNKELNKAWAKANPHLVRKFDHERRSREKQVPTAGIRHALMTRMFDRPCACCGAPGPSEVDHIVPIAWGLPMSGEAWCFQPLCRSCNSRKGARGIWCFVPTGDVG